MEERGIKPLLKERTLYRDEIYEYMKNAIINRVLKPGERIIETKWARELGVSQSPVREAIRELEMVGLVENKPFYGTFVREITAKEVVDAYEVRISLEVLGVREAVKLITDEKLAEIKTTIDEMEKAAEEGDKYSFIEENAAFHQKIMESSGNDMLLKLWKQCNIIEWTHLSTNISSKTLSNLADRHNDVYEAIVERDEEKAVKAIIAHIEELRDEAKKNLVDS